MVFCSAKTLAEQKAIADELEVDVGFITENGAEILLPDGRHHRFGRPYDIIRRCLISARNELGVVAPGYGDIPVQEIADRTGLDLEAAARARSRGYSETIVRLAEADVPALRSALAVQDLRLQRGARFWTVQGDHDKGRTIAWMLGQLTEDIPTYGIGDGPNDVEMLSSVGRPFLVQQPGGVWASVEVDGLERIGGVGPRGWILAAQMVLREVSHR